MQQNESQTPTAESGTDAIRDTHARRRRAVLEKLGKLSYAAPVAVAMLSMKAYAY